MSYKHWPSLRSEETAFVVCHPRSIRYSLGKLLGFGGFGAFFLLSPYVTGQTVLSWGLWTLPSGNACGEL